MALFSPTSFTKPCRWRRNPSVEVPSVDLQFAVCTQLARVYVHQPFACNAQSPKEKDMCKDTVLDELACIGLLL